MIRVGSETPKDQEDDKTISPSLAQEPIRASARLGPASFTLCGVGRRGFMMSYTRPAERPRDYTGALREFLSEKTGDACGYCGTPLTELQIDHVDPYGPDSIHNYMACCRPCNSRKRKLNLEEFREYLGLVGLRDFLIEIDPDCPPLRIKDLEWLSKQPWFPHSVERITFHFESME